MRLSHGIAAAFLATTLTQSASGQSGTIVGTVREADGGPVVGRLVTLSTEWDTVRTRTAANGTFRFDNVADGRYELRIILPGTNPWSQAIDIRNGITVSVNATLRRTVRRLERVLVKGVRTGVFGEIGDITSYKPLDNAIIEVIGFRSADTTSDGGRFSLDSVAGGRNYVVRISRPGYEVKTVGIHVPEKGGFELNAYLDPGVDRSAQDELLWREFDNRADWGGNNAALITRNDLAGGAKASLLSSLPHARPLVMKSLRIHPSALGNPESATYPCIFVNGRAAPRSVLLDYFELGEIEAIEVYGYGTQQHERLAGKFAALPPMYPCGSPPRRSMEFALTGADGAPSATTIRLPLGMEMASRQMISVIVIWLRK